MHRNEDNSESSNVSFRYGWRLNNNLMLNESLRGASNARITSSPSRLKELRESIISQVENNTPVSTILSENGSTFNFSQSSNNQEDNSNFSYNDRTEENTNDTIKRKNEEDSDYSNIIKRAKASSDKEWLSFIRLEFD